MFWLDQLRTVNWGEACVVAIGAYLLGCFATGYYLVRALRGQDIRTLESGNIGARNAGRVLGWTGFLVTTLGDMLKGAFAIWLTLKLLPDARLAAVAMVAVVAGHIWPAQLHFRGGKGVATSLGALAWYDWRLLVLYAAVFACGFLVARRTVLPGLFAFVCLPGADFWAHGDLLRLSMFGLLAVMVVFAHRKNLVSELPGLNTRPGAASKSRRSTL